MLLFCDNFSQPSVRDEKALYWASIFCTGKFWWHIEGMDVNVFMNTILLWNKSWWTVSLKYLQCREGEWEILSEQVLVRGRKRYWRKILKILFRRINAPFDVKVVVGSIRVEYNSTRKGERLYQGRCLNKRDNILVYKYILHIASHVNHASTERYRNSAIPFLQRKLNENIKMERQKLKALLQVNCVS